MSPGMFIGLYLLTGMVVLLLAGRVLTKKIEDCAKDQEEVDKIADENLSEFENILKIHGVISVLCSAIIGLLIWPVIIPAALADEMNKYDTFKKH